MATISSQDSVDLFIKRLQDMLRLIIIGEKLHELRRGADKAEIYCINFNHVSSIFKINITITMTMTIITLIYI